jgi:phage shock protein E
MRRLWNWTRWQDRQRREMGVSAGELERWLTEGRPLQVLDIREAAAFRAGHLPRALHLPLDRLEQDWNLLDPKLMTVVY